MTKVKKSKPRMPASTPTRRTRSFRTMVFDAVVICLAIAASLYAIGKSRQQNAEVHTTTATNGAGERVLCDSHMPSMRSMNHADTTKPVSEPESDPSANAPPVINTDAAPGPAPAGMVWIPGGEFSMGSEDPAMRDALPYHRVQLDGFWMDQTEVTNEEFERFVKATGYATVAERPLNPQSFPGAAPENLVPGAVVFTPPATKVSLDNHFVWWRYVHGANWRHPQGPESDLTGKEKYPVVDIAYEDAQAYAKWAGKRLPTEAEFEFAARGGLDRKKFPWGDEFKPGGKFQANTFQGHFPYENTGDDGFIGTAPVGSFAPNGFGLFDMAGNVWEWTSDWYRPDYYQTLAANRQVVRNPQGPTDSLDPAEPGTWKRVQKGGSFLCTDEYCARYQSGARGKGEPDTGTNHLGFRCVRAAK